MLILRLNKAGAPQDWLDIYQAARYYAQNKVLFENMLKGLLLLYKPYVIRIVVSF